MRLTLIYSSWPKLKAGPPSRSISGGEGKITPDLEGGRMDEGGGGNHGGALQRHDISSPSPQPMSRIYLD